MLFADETLESNSSILYTKRPYTTMMSFFFWTKTFHIVFIVTWFAGIFYLPRLFVYHAQADDKISLERFKVMERKLFYGITTPGAVLSLITGFMMIWQLGWIAPPWLLLKLVAVLILIVYHAFCWRYLNAFKQDSNTHSHVFYRWFNEAPVLLLVVIAALVVFKPM